MQSTFATRDKCTALILCNVPFQGPDSEQSVCSCVCLGSQLLKATRDRKIN